MGMDEFGIIERYFKPLAAGFAGAQGLEDDVAHWTCGDRALVWNTDMLVEGVHFRAIDSAESVGYKLLAVNLADLAAKGARPQGYQLALSLPPGRITEAWLDGFTRGLQRGQRCYGFDLWGGDTTALPGSESSMVLGASCVGTAQHKIPRRSGARVGDVLCVTGTLGDSACALLEGLSQEMSRALELCYLWPTPRLAFGFEAAARFSASMDISDGLLGDVGKLCQASGVGAHINLDWIPCSPQVRALRADDPQIWRAIMGSDDYEILAAVPEESMNAVQGVAQATETPLSVIGRVVADDRRRVVCHHDDSGVLELLEGGEGYRHCF